jgi:hypothetical protein
MVITFSLAHPGAEKINELPTAASAQNKMTFFGIVMALSPFVLAYFSTKCMG